MTDQTSLNSGTASYCPGNGDFYAGLVSDITAKGLPNPPALNVDGSFTRWGDKNSKPCWCVAHTMSNGHLAAYFGDWRAVTSYEYRS